MRLIRNWMVLGLLALGTSALSAAPTPAVTRAAPVEGAKNAQGLTAAIVVNKDSYVLNPAQSGKDFRDKIEAAKGARNSIGTVGGDMGGGERLPQPPAVDLTFRITNTTDKDVTISYGGDDAQMNLKLEGPGAIAADNNIAMTMEFRVGTPMVIAPGQTREVKISSLAFGMRGISNYAYWTEPGDYTITATLTYGIADGKQGTLTSGPAKMTVTRE